MITYQPHFIYIGGNNDRFKQLMFNLIENAVKYSNENGKVYVEAKKEDGKVYISVIDEGIGIPEEHLPRLFERFYTADRARQKSTGLGLSIVRLLAEQMEGRAEARIRDGMLEIRVDLPMAEL